MDVVVGNELLRRGRICILYSFCKCIRGCLRGLRCEQGAGLFGGGPVAGDKEDLIVHDAPVGVDGVAVLQKGFESSVGDDGKFMAQADQLLIIVEDRVRVRQGRLRVDLCVVGIDHDPGGAGGEAGIMVRMHCIISSPEMLFISVTYWR